MSDETIPQNIDFDPDELPEPIKRFSQEEMIGCVVCSRLNPPTRVDCLYCGNGLPASELETKLQRPSARRTPDGENGITIVRLAAKSHPTELAAEISSGLNVPAGIVDQVLESESDIPILRVKEQVEAKLALNKLQSAGVEALAVSDEELGIFEFPPSRIRKLEFLRSSLRASRAGGNTFVDVSWESICLIVSGRLLGSRIEVEQRGKRSESAEVTESTEINTDELVLDIFSVVLPQSLRITASSFDFSCLGTKKDLVTGRNFSTLVRELEARSTRAIVDDQFAQKRQVIDWVWPSEQKQESIGIKRLSPGRYRTESAISRSNENQFTRYSYLANFLRKSGKS